jgi:threonine aldolase
MKKIKAVCEAHHLLFHLDGARLFNALVAKNENAGDYGSLFDSISVCFNKGLGCPAGSMLLGSEKFIQQARRVRKVFGGGMRQAGFLAATALYALDHHIERLSQDHLNAKKIEIALQKHPLVKTILPVETNLVIFELNEEARMERFIAQLKEKGILLLAISSRKLRMITHLDISGEMMNYFLKTLPHIS